MAQRPSPAAQAVAADAQRPGCEAGLRAAKWWLGFAHARMQQSTAGSRLFALVAIALLVVGTLARRLLWRHGAEAAALRRRVAARRRGRCEVSPVRAMITLLPPEPALSDHLVPRLKLKLAGDVANVP